MPVYSGAPVVENSSGQGKQAVVPREVDRWNWGAFLLNWIWGLGNATPLAFLTLVPCVNFVMPFVLGARGSAWAWQNRRWESVEQFRRTQRVWALAALAVIGATLLLGAAVFFAVTIALKQSDVYKLAYAQVSSDPKATSVLGTPIDTGMVQGSINTVGPSGSADISFSVSGPKAKGTLYTQATKDVGRWRIDRMELELDGAASRIPLVAASAPHAPSLPAKPSEL